MMGAIVQYTDWLEEEVGNMAREGLRTLVVARKMLTEEQYLDFEVILSLHKLCFFCASTLMRLVSKRCRIFLSNIF